MTDDEESDAWDSGEIGASEEFMSLAPAAFEKEIDDHLGLQQITIRLQKTLVADLKEMARQNGLGYQPFVRQILTKHVAENRLKK
ncbi:MAG: hypothetical protein KGS72_10400 [Cyanobacteria bacterium REEB67]|nr:hypothetical protein [Cyanobacteria bacterium REEB67]